jgi:hypothetical protein
LLAKIEGRWIDHKPNKDNREFIEALRLKNEQTFNDQAGFRDEELQEAIDSINWYQTPEEVAADAVWVKETTQGIIERTRALRKARGSV